MILLSARQLSRQFDQAPIFQGVTFEVRPGDKIGLVGPNGAGKSTLLRILTGEDDADKGQLDFHPTTRWAMLEQQANFAPGRTLIAEARAGLGELYQLQQESVDLAHKIAAEEDETARQRWQKRYDAVQQQLHQHDAYNLDHRVDEVLLGLGFSADQYDRDLATFSGGQQNRVLLARMLLSDPNLMLLDEPTNHLDIATTEWLENYLARSPVAMIVVSHDRYFLDKVTNRTLELNGGQLTDYVGNFSAYWGQRAERALVQMRAWEKQQEEIADLEDFIVKNRYGQKHAQAADRVKKLERIERIEKPVDMTTVPMGFGKPSRSGDWVIDAEQLSKGFDAPLFEDVTLRIHRGDRVGIFGPNGSGKTTLLRTLLGELPPSSGKCRFGTGVEIGYFDQQLTSVDPTLDAIEAIRPPNRPEITPGHLRDYLARFGLKGEIVFQQVGSMSGGEKSKVALARLAVLQVNLLVLDEPTNHLDLWACAALESALKEFDGTLLFVSHDRYFLDRVSTHVISFEPDRVRFFEGNYTAYHDFLKLRAEEAAAAQTRSQSSSSTVTKTDKRNNDKPTRRKRKFSYRKPEDIEADIATHEVKVTELEASLISPDVLRDGERTKQVQQEYEATRARLTELYEHWEEAIELS